MPGGTGRLLVRTPLPFSSEKGGGPGTEPERYRRVVFGTLLGPEATGPWLGPRSPLGGVRGRVVGLVFLVSWLHRSHGCLVLLGAGVCGVCGTGLLFENYIVDASIFYKKQFPRI